MGNLTEISVFLQIFDTFPNILKIARRSFLCWFHLLKMFFGFISSKIPIASPGLSKSSTSMTIIEKSDSEAENLENFDMQPSTCFMFSFNLSRPTFQNFLWILGNIEKISFFFNIWPFRGHCPKEFLVLISTSGIVVQLYFFENSYRFSRIVKMKSGNFWTQKICFWNRQLENFDLQPPTWCFSFDLAPQDRHPNFFLSF